ncbi:MAG: DUF4296 domain-containing protein [Bacteroidia bacterium]
MKHPLFYILILSAFCSCSESEQKSESKPDWVLNEDKMVDVLVDLRIVDAATYSNTNSPPRDKIKDWYFVMKKHHVEDSIFRKSNDYYAQHPEQAEKLYERVIDRISEMQANNAYAQ